MAYATQDDIVTLYSEDALFVADRDDDGVADAVAIDRALDYASGEIDSYLAARYTLPLPTALPLLSQFCVDIALYRLALARDVLTEEHRRRYEDTLKHLKDIARGVAALNLPAPIDPETGAAEETGPNAVLITGPERVFTRDRMRGL
ncbi:gp436 family protein [Palleronia caenipelagi]|uniref:DUF1320 domain-containing protein n=1 Tax=Palleronia caenipelagi TaxID=2489174 RepID=A0A547PW57_9RHOB|nr:DUF1320 domain-containing protein [Palleronia caenipelagi]TRD18390.1 DUF1320 domain-containing protein [Palleronia caenipelagi]